MAWVAQKTARNVNVDAEVTVDLSDFSELALLQALIDSDWINRAEAEAIQQRAKAKEQKAKPISGLGAPIDWEELTEACDWVARRRVDEAVFHLERALGREWYGLLSRAA